MSVREDDDDFDLPGGTERVALDVSSIADEERLLDAVARALDFPSYFAGSWDALKDCLRDVPENRQADAVVLELRHAHLMRDRAPALLDAFISAWDEVAAELADDGYGLDLELH